MKKAFLVYAILSLPVFAMCPIDENNINGENVCSIGSFREPYNPNFSATSSNVRELDSASVKHPLDNSNLDNKMRDFSGTRNDGYNSNCQFGVCLPDRTRPLFQQGGQDD